LEREGTALVQVLKDSLQRRERVILATNKVMFCGAENDDIEFQSGDFLRHYPLKLLPEPTPGRSHKNWS
jgi:hypothetical protein